MRRGVLLVLVLAGCDPVWGVDARVRDPGDRPLDDAMVAVACAGVPIAANAVARTKHDGAVFVGGLGTAFPPGCDVYVAKPGYRTHRIRYRDLCPHGVADCARMFSFDLVLEPE